MARRIAGARTMVVLPVVALVSLVAVPALAPARTRAAAPHTRVDVSPSTGGPVTMFAIRFRAPDRTGRKAGSERRYLLSVSGPANEQDCLDGADRALPFSRAGARVKALLDPRHLGGRWCTGTFHGRVEEIRTLVCPHGTACPRFVELLGTIGRFRFTVRPGGAKDTTPPVFAGVKTANACTPGAQRPGETTPFTLTWDAATDAVTSTSRIIYDVYESGTAGGEDFSHPSWTTSPGVTSFRTPGLPSHGTFYFVVRARDQAGNEDRNRVERLGVDPCL